MIVQSTRISRKGGVRYLAHHLLGKADENEKIEVLAGDRHALDDAQALARLKGCRYSVRHLSISPQREMTPRQLSAFLRAIDTEFKVGLERPRLVVRHVKKGRSHFHIAVSEVDPVTLRVLDCRKDFARLENLARRYEADNGEQVQPTRAERRTQRAEGFSDVARKRAERCAPKFDRTRLRQAAMRGRAAFLREIDNQNLRIEGGDKAPILVSNDGAFVAAACRAAGMRRGEFQNFLHGGSTNEQLIGSQTRVPEHPRERGRQHSAAPAASIVTGNAGTTRPTGPTSGNARSHPRCTAPAGNRIENTHRESRPLAAAIARRRHEDLFLRNLGKVDLDDLLRRARELAKWVKSIFEPQAVRLARQIDAARRTQKSFPDLPAETTTNPMPTYDFRRRIP